MLMMKNCVNAIGAPSFTIAFVSAMKLLEDEITFPPEYLQRLDESVDEWFFYRVALSVTHRTELAPYAR